MKALLLCVCMVVSNPAFSDQSIHRMMMDGKIFALAGTRQITPPAEAVAGLSISPDGKYIAYFDAYDVHDDSCRLCLARVSDGQSVVLISRPPNITDEGFVGDLWEPQLGLTEEGSEWPSIAWSPDSRLFAVPVSHVTVGKENSPVDFGIAVYRFTGARQAYFPLKDVAELPGQLIWSPDSRRLACPTIVREPESRCDLLIFDVSAGSTNVLLSRSVILCPVLWLKEGKALQYTTEERLKFQLREIGLDGKSDQLIQAQYDGEGMSPDRVFELTEPGISIKNYLTGETTEVLKASPGRILGWAPNSKMIMYQRSTEIKDEIGKRKRTLNMTWLAATEANPLNHMCATFDSEWGELPTWSKDCLKMAYACDGRVCVAEFSWKDPTFEEKLAAGLPLTEDEEKEALMRNLVMNAKQIGVAFNMYTSDNDGKYPSAATFMQDLFPYLRLQDANLFNRPGTNQPIFQYFPLGSIGDVKYPSTTMIGMFDVGYGWKVILYADGHVQVVPKN